MKKFAILAVVIMLIVSIGGCNSALKEENEQLKAKVQELETLVKACEDKSKIGAAEIDSMVNRVCSVWKDCNRDVLNTVFTTLSFRCR